MINIFCYKCFFIFTVLIYCNSCFSHGLSRDDLNILLKEKELFEESLEINKYLEGAGKKKASNSEVKKIIDSLNIIDEDLDGLKNYYNTYANIYNDYLDRGFFRFIYKLMHLEKKELFDVRKLEDYEILKN